MRKSKINKNEGQKLLNQKRKIWRFKVQLTGAIHYSYEALSLLTLKMTPIGLVKVQIKKYLQIMSHSIPRVKHKILRCIAQGKQNQVLDINSFRNDLSCTKVQFFQIM